MNLSKIATVSTISLALIPGVSWGVSISDGVKSAGAEAAQVFSDAGTAAGPIIAAIFIVLAGIAVFYIVRGMMS